MTDKLKPTSSRDGYHVITNDLRVGLVMRLVSRRTNRVTGWQMYLRAGPGCGDYIPAGVSATRAAAVRQVLRRST